MDTYDRHIYNSSNDQWYVAATQASFPDIPGGQQQGDGFVYGFIPPNTTITISYEQGEQGYLTLQQSYLPAATWHWSGTTISPAAPYIEHDGSTTGLNMNEPANGDVQLFGDPAPPG